MRAILIDPVTRMMSEVEHAGGLASIYRWVQCQTVDAVRLHERECAIYVDDNGLADERRADRWRIQINDLDSAERFWTHWLVGRGLAVGTTPRGEDADCPFTIEELAPRMGWRYSWVDAARQILRDGRAGYVAARTGALIGPDARTLPSGALAHEITPAVAVALIWVHDAITDEVERVRFDTTDVVQAAEYAVRLLGLPES